MSTPYQRIYERAAYRFKDYDFLSMNEAEISDVQHAYLNSVIGDFESLCKENLSDRDELTNCFNADLSNEVQEILALGIAYYWVSSQVLNEDLFNDRMSTKDYSFFSPANLLREAHDVKNTVYKEYQGKMTLYSYRHGNISSLTENG